MRLSRTMSWTPAAGNRDRLVPVFTLIRSTREEPDCVPAVSPRVRRRPSSWPPGQQRQTDLRVPRRHRQQVRTAPGPESARFEPVSQRRDIKRRFLAYFSPSRSPDLQHLAVLATSRLSQGCSHPPPAPPGSGCPQLQRPATTGRRRRSPTSARIHSASWRKPFPGQSPVAHHRTGRSIIAAASSKKVLLQRPIGRFEVTITECSRSGRQCAGRTRSPRNSNDGIRERKYPTIDKYARLSATKSVQMA